jgi:hypothetical protein
MEALLIQLPKTEGQPHIYRRNRHMITGLSVTSPLASLLVSYLVIYLTLSVDYNKYTVYSQHSYSALGSYSSIKPNISRFVLSYILFSGFIMQSTAISNVYT